MYPALVSAKYIGAKLGVTRVGFEPFSQQFCTQILRRKTFPPETGLRDRTNLRNKAGGILILGIPKGEKFSVRKLY